MQIYQLKIASLFFFIHSHPHIQTDNIMLKQDGTRSEEQKDAAQVESYVAQRYIENPYLINGDKLNEEYTFIVVNYQMCL